MKKGSSGASLRVRAVGLALLVAISVVLFEVACQVWAVVSIFPELERIRTHALHPYEASENPRLAYQLQAGSALEVDGRWLRVNRYSLREDSDDLAPNRRRIGLIGDSVLFGIEHDQDQTISVQVQRSLDQAGEDARVFNAGVPGYGLAEIAENLRVVDDVYDFSDIVYLLNLNDFSRRDSIYEGADNGLYRTYQAPVLMSPWFIGKVIYRYQKGGHLYGDDGWYRWLFEGNEEWGYRQLDDMIEESRSRGARFSVVLLPAGIAYIDGEYVLADVHADIQRYLAARGVPVLSPVEDFRGESGELIDESDHMYQPGLELMGRLIAEFIMKTDRG